MNIQQSFDLLGLSKNASPEEVKRAKKRKAKEYHPDTNPDYADGEMMRKVNIAFDNIRSYMAENVRSDYRYENGSHRSSGRYAWQQRGRSNAEFFNFKEIFEKMSDEKLYNYRCKFSAEVQALIQVYIDRKLIKDSSEVWITHDYRVCSVKQMDTRHLNNALRSVKNKLANRIYTDIQDEQRLKKQKALFEKELEGRNGKVSGGKIKVNFGK